MNTKTKFIAGVLLGCALVLAFIAIAGCVSEENFTPTDVIVGVWEELHDSTSSSYSEYRIYSDNTYKCIVHFRKSDGWKSESVSGIWSGPKTASEAYYDQKRGMVDGSKRQYYDYYTLTSDYGGLTMLNLYPDEKDVLYHQTRLLGKFNMKYYRV